MTTIPDDIQKTAAACSYEIRRAIMSVRHVEAIIGRSLLTERERGDAEIAALKAELAQEQEDNADMLLIAHLDGAADARDVVKALKADNERLREALSNCAEVFALVERPAFEDPLYANEVKALGERIGYGALMASASASWASNLQLRGVGIGGEFVAGPCRSTISSVLSTARAALEGK
jgi:hypothetical protein